jgi:hypothetical protein
MNSRLLRPEEVAEPKLTIRGVEIAHSFQERNEREGLLLNIEGKLEAARCMLSHHELTAILVAVDAQIGAKPLAVQDRIRVEFDAINERARQPEGDENEYYKSLIDGLNSGAELHDDGLDLLSTYMAHADHDCLMLTIEAKLEAARHVLDLRELITILRAVEDQIRTKPQAVQDHAGANFCAIIEKATTPCQSDPG